MAPWTAAHQAPFSMGFPRQEYWSGSPFPSPGDLPNPGAPISLETHLLMWQADTSVYLLAIVTMYSHKSSSPALDAHRCCSLLPKAACGNNNMATVMSREETNNHAMVSPGLHFSVLLGLPFLDCKAVMVFFLQC